MFTPAKAELRKNRCNIHGGSKFPQKKFIVFGAFKIFNSPEKFRIYFYRNQNHIRLIFRSLLICHHGSAQGRVQNLIT